MANFVGFGVVHSDVVYTTKVLAQIFGHTTVQAAERLLVEAKVPTYKWNNKTTLVSGKLFQEAIERLSRPGESEATKKAGDNRKLLNRKSAATYLGVSSPTLGKLTREGHIRVVRIPGTTAKRYTISSLDKFIERQAKKYAKQQSPGDKSP